MSRFTCCLLLLAIVVVTLMTDSATAKLYNRCSMAWELKNMGIPKDELATWVCLAEKTSQFNSKAITKKRDGSHNYGIIPINDRQWCARPSGPSGRNQCNIKCKDLLVDSIKPAMDCAQLIRERRGWTAWSEWYLCDGHLPSLKDCFK